MISHAFQTKTFGCGMFPPTMRWRCAGNGRRYEEDEKRYVTRSFLASDFVKTRLLQWWICELLIVLLFLVAFVWRIWKEHPNIPRLICFNGSLQVILPDGSTGMIDLFDAVPLLTRLWLVLVFCDFYLEPSRMIQFWRNQVSWFQVDVSIVHRCGDDPILTNIEID